MRIIGLSDPKRQAHERLAIDKRNRIVSTFGNFCVFWMINHARDPPAQAADGRTPSVIAAEGYGGEGGSRDVICVEGGSGEGGDCPRGERTADGEASGGGKGSGGKGSGGKGCRGAGYRRMGGG